MCQGIGGSTDGLANAFHPGVELHLLLLREGTVLFRRGDDGRCHPPVVLPEEGESLVEAVVRDARAALGVTVKPEDVSLAHVTHDLAGNGTITLFFAVSRWESEPAALEPPGSSGLCWLPVTELPGSSADPAHVAVRGLVRGETFSTTVSADGQASRLEAKPRFRSDIARAVSAFHAAFGLPRKAAPSLEIDESLAQLRIALLEEESGELVQAVGAHDLVAIADALADIVYVAYGTALTYGIDLDLVLTEVHRANMSKLGADGKPVRREDGKVLKSDRYRPPDVAGVLGLPERSPAAPGRYSNKK